MNDFAVEINNFSYAYQSHWTFLKKPFVQNVSLKVAAGEVFGFIGHNGAGKTTTIKALVGLSKPTDGELKIFGEQAGSLAALSEIGFLPEQPYFYDYIKVKEVVEMAAVLKGFDGKDLATEIDRVLDRVGIAFKKNQKLRSLSKGQVQRVALAQALVGNPRLLILDEPFSGLDPIGRKEFADIFHDLKANGTSIFISSHVLADIESLCDRAGIMRNGELAGVYELSKLSELLIGKYRLEVSNYLEIKDQLINFSEAVKERDSYIELEIEDKETAEQAAKLVMDSDAELRSYRYSHGGLEQLFIEKIQENSGK